MHAELQAKARVPLPLRVNLRALLRNAKEDNICFAG